MSDTSDQSDTTRAPVPGWVGDTLKIPSEYHAVFAECWQRTVTMILAAYPETVCTSCRSIITRDEQFTSEVVVVRRADATEASMINVMFRCLPCTVTAGHKVIGSDAV